MRTRRDWFEMDRCLVFLRSRHPLFKLALDRTKFATLLELSLVSRRVKTHQGKTARQRSSLPPSGGLSPLSRQAASR